MRKPDGYKSLKLVSLRLPFGMLADIDRIAETTHREKSYLIRRALEIYLNEYADYQIALDRLNDEADGIIDSREMRKLAK